MQMMMSDPTVRPTNATLDEKARSNTSTDWLATCRRAGVFTKLLE